MFRAGAPEPGTGLSIIVVNWNTRDLLEGCLTSVYAHPPTGQFEVIVVDNDSTDGSAQMVRERFASVVLLENRQNVGFARANNQALAVCRGEFVLLLNSDTLVAAGAVQKLLRVLAEEPRAGACGGRLVNGDRSFQASYADFPTLTKEAVHLLGLGPHLLGAYFPSYGPRESTRLRRAGWVGGAFLLARRACLDEVGALDEGFVMYGEEMDWCFRAQRHGWEVWYCPDAEIVHFGGRSADRVPVWKYVQIQRGKVRFFRKHYGRLATLLLVLLIRTISLLKVGVLLPIWGLQKASGRRGRRSEKWKNYFAAATSRL